MKKNEMLEIIQSCRMNESLENLLLLQQSIDVINSISFEIILLHPEIMQEVPLIKMFEITDLNFLHKNFAPYTPIQIKSYLFN